MGADFVVKLNLTMRHKTRKGDHNGCHALREQPKIEIERKIGNTTYIVNGFFASQGVTVSKKSCGHLTRKQKSKKFKNR